MSNQEHNLPFFTPGQKRLFSITICALSIFVLFLLAGWLLRSITDFLHHFSSVIWPLAISSILTVFLSPVVGVIEKKLSLGRGVSIIILYCLIILAGACATWTVGGEIVRQTRELVGSSVNWPERIETQLRQSMSPGTWEGISQKYNNFKRDWKETLNALGSQAPKITKGSAGALKDAWAGINSFLSSLACMAIIPIYLYYFLGSRQNHLDKMVTQLSFLSTGTREDLRYLVLQFREIIEAFFRGQLLIGILMGVGYAVGFSLAGLKFGIALGLFFGVLNMVPFLGSVVGLVTAFTVSYLQPGGILESGEWNILWGCGITFALVQFLESYWLSPKVMGGRTGLHPVVIIASVFFWGTAFGGILGMILGIPLTAFLIILWRLLRQKYIPS